MLHTSMAECTHQLRMAKPGTSVLLHPLSHWRHSSTEACIVVTILDDQRVIMALWKLPSLPWGQNQEPGLPEALDADSVAS